MPLLAALLGSAFSAVVAWLSAFVTKKVAVAAALAAFFGTGWLAFQVGLRALYEGLAFVVPAWMSPPLAVVAYLLPSNFNTCLAACLAALYARFVWDRQREWAKAVASV